jgi:serine/threonine protein kinase
MPRERIGEGGFGAVYRCEQPLLGREAVIKVLHSRLRASEVMADSGSKRVLEPKHNRHVAKSGRKRVGIMELWRPQPRLKPEPFPRWCLPRAGPVRAYRSVAGRAVTARGAGSCCP